MKSPYKVRHAFRVGVDQQWHLPGEQVQLLPCEAQYALSRGWLKPSTEAETAPTAPTDTAPQTAAKTATHNIQQKES